MAACNFTHYQENIQHMNDTDFPDGYDQLVITPGGAQVGLRFNEEGFERVLTDEETEELIERQRQEAADALADSDHVEDEDESFHSAMFSFDVETGSIQQLAGDAWPPDLIEAISSMFPGAVPEPQQAAGFHSFTEGGKTLLVLADDEVFVSMEALFDALDQAYDSAMQNRDGLMAAAPKVAQVMAGRAQLAAELEAHFNALLRRAGAQLHQQGGC